ncbi:phosphatase 2C-like domain-containing protein [Cladorrhinum sp. PSN332]|nr:phosphatase 2C-like domain-containing protein [Cladorrhinum sp. PSN332]
MLPIRGLPRVMPGRLGAYRQFRRPFSSSPTPSSTKKTNTPYKYLAVAGVVGAPCLWWFSKSRHEPTEKRDSVPSLNSTSTNELVLPPGPSNEQVTRILNEQAYSFNVTNVPGVSRYDGAQFAANSPCEDRFMHGSFPSPWNDGQSAPWMAWGVFDGHLGWQTADLLTQKLLPFVRHHLSLIPASQRTSTEAIHRAIHDAFTSFDKQLVSGAYEALTSGVSSVESTSETNSSAPNASTSASNKTTLAENALLQSKVKALSLAAAGSCALLTLYDPQTSTLHVACTGDSRAILGQQDPSTKKWDVVPLSTDQDLTHNQSEIDRLNAQHPDEPNMIKNGRVLGMMVSRAFGDSQWKWSLEKQEELMKKYHGLPPFQKEAEYISPPYLIADPVITSTRLGKGKKAILVMASDGLWYWTKNNGQVIDAVTAWVDGQGQGEGKNKDEKNYQTGFDFSEFRKRKVDYRMDEKRMAVRDGNAAVHLVRNSLGGDHDELLAGRVAYEPPFARRVRDDVTVQVVFFQS